MKVLYYIAYPQRMAGANRVLYSLITNLPAQVSPVVVLADDGDLAHRYRSAGVEVHVVRPAPSLNEYGKAMLSWSRSRCAWEACRALLPYTLRLQRLIRRLRPDIVHINDVRGGILAGPAARAARRPVVGHVHGEIATPGAPQRMFETVCDQVITVSRAVQRCLGPRARRKCQTVYNGIDGHEIFRRSSEGESLPWLQSMRARGRLVLCCVASLVPFKGIHHLLEAVAQLNARGWKRQIVLLVVGDFVEQFRDYQQFLWRRQRDLSLDNVTFTGWQSNPLPFFRLSDISVLPSVSREVLNFHDTLHVIQGNEGFPMTHLEAMCCGLPVVGTNISGVPELIEHDKTGLVVPPSNVTALVRALQRLLKDRTLRTNMGARGRERVARLFAVDKQVSGVMAVYRSVLADQGHAINGRTAA